MNVGPSTGLTQPLNVNGVLSVANGATVALVAGSTRVTNNIAAVSLGTSGTLDIGSHNVFLNGNYTAVNAAVKQAAGAPVGPSGLNPWTGAGITSSLVKTDATNGHPNQSAIAVVDNADFVANGGKNVPAGKVLVSYAAYGDANLDNVVDIADLSIWNNNFFVGDHWGQGDFNYDGIVDIADLSIWNNNFFGSVSPSSPAAGKAIVASSSATSPTRSAFTASPKTLSGGEGSVALAPATPPAGTLELDIDPATGDAVLNSGGITLQAIQISSASKSLVPAGWKSFAKFYGVSGWAQAKGTPNTQVVAESTADASSTGTPLILASGSLTDYGNILPVGFNNLADLTFSYNKVINSAGNTVNVVGVVAFVPEPTSVALVALAGAGLLARRRRRKG